MSFRILASALFVALPIIAQAGGSLDLSLSNESIRLEHEAVRAGTGIHLTTGFLYSEREEAYAFSAGFNAVDATLANRELVGGFGFKGFVFDAQAVSDLGIAVAVGGFLRWQPDFMNGLGTEVNLYYAPSILSFRDATAFQEIIARATYKILPQARLFAGWHDVSAYYGGSTSRTIMDTTFHLGFRINY